MIFACVILAHAFSTQGATPVEIKIQHMRASKALELMSQPQSTYHSMSGLEADDLKGTVSVTGNLARVNEVKALAKLVDIPRRRLSVNVTVDSVVDKESYQVAAKIWNLQKWKTGDGDTGITVAIEPRLGENNTVTLMVVCGRDNSNTLQETFRMKLGASRTITMGTHLAKVYHQKPDGTFDYRTEFTPEPKITIRVDK